MSITDELRNEARAIQTFTCMAEQTNRLFDIADRIDAEHERVCYDYQREFEDWKFVHDTEFMELPKDADGVPIHVGDKVTHCGRRVYEVDAVLFFKDNVSVSFKGESGCGCDSGNNFHHYHEPTVEEVLREFGDWYAHVKGGCDEEGIISEYAAKLRLADDGKERQ